MDSHPLEGKDIYVLGQFNDYQANEESQMHYDPKSQKYFAKIFLKQGFYNYKFATKAGNIVDFNEISGNFQQTENTYLVLVYYRAPGALYDEVVGIGSASSTNITK